MSVLLTCDAPACTASVPAIVRAMRPAAPAGWWMQVRGNALLVGCCERHLVAAAEAAVSGSGSTIP